MDGCIDGERELWQFVRQRRRQVEMREHRCGRGVGVESAGALGRLEVDV